MRKNMIKLIPNNVLAVIKKLKVRNLIMRKIVFVLLSAFVLVLCACGSGEGGQGEQAPSIVPKSEAEAAPEGSVSFEIKNATGGDIYEAYVAVAETEEFGSDILKERIIKADDSMSVYILPTENAQYYDLKVLREDGDFYTWLNVPVGTFEKLNLMLGDEGPEFTVE